MTQKEVFTWKESFSNHDYDTLESFRFHLQGWEFIPRPATILTKQEMDLHFTQLPIMTITSNHILHKFEVTLDETNTERDLIKNNNKKNMRGHSYNDSVDPTWTQEKHEIIMKQHTWLQVD